MPKTDDLTVRNQLTEGKDALATTALGLATIITRDDAEKASTFLRAVRTRIRAIEAHYQPIKRAVRNKMNEAMAEIARLEADDINPWQAADVQIAQPLQAWILADRIAVEAANRKALEDAEATARAARAEQAEALRAAALTAATVREQKTLQAEARAVERSAAMPVMGPVIERAKLDGIATPTRTVADVVDMRLLLRAIVGGKVPEAAVKIDQVWLDAQATSRGKDLNFPGVIVRDKVSLSARGL